jgi:hypothetical protein
MSFSYENYLKAKDNFCFIYNGNYKEYIWQFLQLKKHAEIQFPELKLYLAVSPQNANEIQQNGIVNRDNIRNYYFLKVQEINFNFKENAIVKILENSQIEIKMPKINLESKKFFINNDVVPPFKKLNEIDLNKIKNKISEKLEITDLSNADTIFSVESEILYKYAFLGKKTFLIETNENSEIYKKLFPNGEIFNIKHI